MKSLYCLMLLCMSFPALLHGAEGPRTALVMGVWDYEGTGTGGISFPSLPGIEADVKKMTAKLNGLGFQVTTVVNPTLVEAREAIDEFGKRLAERKGTGLFYFSGHGCEQEGKNFLIPRRAAIASKRDLPAEAVPAERVLARMAEGGAVNLVFLDCCRNGLTKGGGEGLAPMEASGVFIGFATASERVANASTDGSVYTSALLKHMDEPGASITDMHSRVTGEVVRITAEQGSRQTPFSYSGLSDVYYLVPPGSPGIVTVPSVVTSVPPVTPVAQPPPITETIQPASIWLLPDSSRRLLSRDEVARLGRNEAWRGRNEIFARHGYIFATEKGKMLARSLGNEYQPRTEDQDAVYAALNNVERANVDAFKAIESGALPAATNNRPSESFPPSPSGGAVWVFPDSDSRYLTRQEVSQLNSSMAWRARNEIYARQGLIFSSAEGRALARSLGRYYSPVSKDAEAIERTFNSYQRANVELLKALGAKK